MKINDFNTKVCPCCHKPYKGYGALSRIDNESLICPDCGTRQALAYIGVDEKEVESIINLIHEVSYKA